MVLGSFKTLIHISCLPRWHVPILVYYMFGKKVNAKYAWMLTYSPFQSPQMVSHRRWHVEWIVQGWPKTLVHVHMCHMLGRHLPNLWMICSVTLNEQGCMDNMCDSSKMVGYWQQHVEWMAYGWAETRFSICNNLHQRKTCPNEPWTRFMVSFVSIAILTKIG